MTGRSCDLLEKLYLCGINNNNAAIQRTRIQVVICLKNCTFVVSTTTPPIPPVSHICVVICLKNCTFVVSTTTDVSEACDNAELWFAWKIVPLWYQQQQACILLYICSVVICLKNCTFVVSTTTCCWFVSRAICCDLLEKLYLCGINNNSRQRIHLRHGVVICLKNCTFVVSTTTTAKLCLSRYGCDLLEKLYLCGINNNKGSPALLRDCVVICLKNCTFVVSTTT